MPQFTYFNPSMETNITESLSEDLVHQPFGLPSSMILPAEDLYDGSDEENTPEDSEEPDDVIILHMDIREPLHTLRLLLEGKVGLNLTEYTFWLQDAQELEPHKNLVDQCVKGEGLVQINVQIQTTNQRINIIDVLKPTEAALGWYPAALSAESDCKKEILSNGSDTLDDCTQLSLNDFDMKTSVGDNSPKERPCLNWVPDSKFKREQSRLKIPDDPKLWTVQHVKHWFQWAMREFNLAGVSIADWSITGEQLCTLSHQEFRQKLPNDPGNIFWTHLQLLKECKYVAIVHKDVEAGLTKSTPSSPSKNFSTVAKSQRELKVMRKSLKTDQKSPFRRGNIATSSTNSENSSNNSTASGGQMQLWQFLLELLTDSNHTDVIQWVGGDGEFKLIDPEAVARLWGIKKNKPAMNYEKLSRALRYYYDGDMISKVCGKRFVYKFDCDLKLLIGYDAGELARLVSCKPYITQAAYAEQSKDSDDE